MSDPVLNPPSKGNTVKKTLAFLLVGGFIVAAMFTGDRCSAREDAIPLTDAEVFEARTLDLEETRIAKLRADYNERLKQAHQGQLATGWNYSLDLSKKAIVRGSPIPPTPMPGVPPKK